MKNIDETVQSVFDRMDAYKVKQHRRKKIALGIAIPVCSVCLIAVVGFGIGKTSSAAEQPPITKPSILGPIFTDTIDAAVATTPIEEIPASEPTVPSVENGNKIVIIAADWEINSNHGIARLLDDFMPMTKDELIAYYGCNVFPVVPDDICLSEKQHWGLYRQNKGTGEIYYEQNRQIYENAYQTRGLVVETRKGRYPFFDFVIDPEKEEYSTVCGQDVAIGQYPDGSYGVWFLHNNVGYYLSAVGLTQDELIGIIESLIA